MLGGEEKEVVLIGHGLFSFDRGEGKSLLFDTLTAIETAQRRGAFLLLPRGQKPETNEKSFDPRTLKANLKIYLVVSSHIATQEDKVGEWEAL